MARTRASVAAKVSSGKSSKARCSAAPAAVISSSTGSGSEKSRSSGGGNTVCQRQTPKWQKPITTFFNQPQKQQDGTGAACSSKSKPKRNVIESSDEETSPKKHTKKSPEKSPSENPSDSVTPTKVTDSPQKLTENISPPKKSPPRNSELDETIELEELTGEDSHKIEEYYPKTYKGKGVGKKSRGKENVINNNYEGELKRDREDDIVEENCNKKMKIN